MIVKIICIHHSVDLDGWTSAAIVKHWFKKTYPNASSISNIDVDEHAVRPPDEIDTGESLDFLGYNYGDPIPDLSEYDEVIMCDISFPIDEMIKIKDKLIWIDHHKSAINDYENYKKTDKTKEYQEVKLATDFAACELTWMHFFPDEEMPELVRLLGRYDCFGHRQIWSSIIGYEGLYEVSNQGNVRSLHKGIKELSIAKSKRGYRVVSLSKNGETKMKTVHQLVAQAFIPNSENKPCINHKDFNRLNNYINNLEWCTYAENNLHSIEEGNRGKTVIQSSQEDQVIQIFDSIRRAEEHTGVANQNISKVCKGERELAGGFKWEYGIDKDVFPQFVPVDEEQKVLEFQYGARSVISNYEEAYNHLYESLNRSDLSETIENEILEKGEAVYAYLCTEAKQDYTKGFPIELKEPIYNSDGSFTGQHTKRKFLAISKERFNPINFGIDYHKDGYDGVACFWYANGGWSFSLYNDNGLVDCSSIAKSFGGGGHKGASGMIIEHYDLTVILNKN